jgi:hypothetical protein
VTPSHRLKLERAAQQFETLKALSEKWAKRKPIVIVRDFDAQTEEYVQRVRVRKPLDPTAPLLVGECVHGLRQALDYLAYQLAIVVSGEDPPPNADTTQFPITTSRQRFDGGIAQKIGKATSMPAGLYEALEQMQPYLGGHRELLGYLRELDDIDKHRFLPVVAGSLQKAGINAPRRWYGRRAKELCLGDVRVPGGSGEDGSPVLYYTLDPKAQHHPDIKVTPTVAFGAASPVLPNVLTVELLDKIGTHVVNNVVTPLERFLP